MIFDENVCLNYINKNINRFNLMFNAQMFNECFQLYAVKKVFLSVELSNMTEEEKKPACYSY